jgi:L-Ala-D/L-Glu epimerase / N-acetyl-D-glutamate racemase
LANFAIGALKPMALSVEVTVETWPIAGTFAISRGAKREAVVVVARVSDGRATGRGECVPYARYGETVDTVCAAIEGVRGLTSRAALQQQLPAGAARNALDCALWDYEAKRNGTTAAELAGLTRLRPLTTAYTLSLDTAEAMATKAAAASKRGLPLLKLKLGGPGDDRRMREVRAACPNARLIADANEAWTPALLPELMRVAAETRIELIEQPLHASADTALAGGPHPVPVCADESLHTRAGLAELAGRYDAINIKLDKAGGLTEALLLAAAAREAGLKIMVGCMVATSLAMAPAMLVAQRARIVDLDGALLLARDRLYPLRYEGSRVHPPSRALWG